MRRITFLFALTTFFSTAWAEFSGLPDFVNTKLGAIQKYPLASSILFWCSETHSLDASGSNTYEWHSFRYFPDEAARDSYGDPRINYAEGRQTVEILRARTYTRDGRQIDCTPENAYNPVVPDGLDLAPEFSDYRQLVVTLLGLENGSISELHYRITAAKPLLPWLEGRVYFREEIPVISRELIVQLPSGFLLTYRGDRGAPEPEQSGTRYVWKVGEQPGYLAEDLSGHRELLSNVAYTSAKDWSQICEFLNGQIQAAERDPIVHPESLRNSLAGLYTVDERIEAIGTWVRERFNKIDFAHPDFTLALRTTADVLHSGYGNELELTLLVKALATANGIRMELAPRFQPEPHVPYLHEWTAPALVVHSDLGTTYLADALVTRSEANERFAGSAIYDMTNCRLREESPRAGGDPRFSLWLSIENMNGDTIDGHGSLIAVGNWGAVESIQQDGLISYMNTLVGLPGFDCRSAHALELTDRGRVSVRFDFVCNALDAADDYRVLELGALDFGEFVDGAPWSLPSREFAQEIQHVGKVHLLIDADVPDDWEIARKPASSSGTWDWSSGEVKCEMNDGHLIYERDLNLAREWLAPTGWAGFREWIVQSGPRPNHVVAFKTK